MQKLSIIKKSLFISLLLLISSISFAEETININNDTLYSQSKLKKEFNKAINNNDYIRASSLFPKILKKNPNEDNKFLYAEILYKANKLDEAYKQYNYIYNTTKNNDYKKKSLYIIRYINFINNEKKMNLSKKDKQVLKIKNDEKIHYLCNPSAPSISNNGNIYRWSKSDFPLKVYIPKLDYSLNLINDELEYTNTIIQAFKSWEMTSKGLVSFIRVTSEKDANIILNWKNYFDDNAWGKAQFPHYNKDFNKKVSFLYLAVRAQPGSALYTDKEVLFSQKELLEITIHEIGHTLGLNHSFGYKDNDDIMKPYISSKMPEYIAKITNRDLNSLYNLYSLQDDKLYKCF